ncbi:MAG: pyridoxamine 5'-phosphate oxidase family protein [Deltaproteobacteria bacterium]|nr:pyridoxamine 5'-phosphate oxidase family protein [Deltaproteobacteria bacterium]
MELKDYFEQKHGLGVLSTCDSEGKINSAVYSRPVSVENGSIAFIMTSRKSYANIQQNPNAFYLFVEEGKGYKGKRLSLTKTEESTDQVLIESLRRRFYSEEKEQAMSPLHLVYFRVDRERPLLG